MADWLFCGKLLQFPKLKLAYSEGQIGWIPYIRVDAGVRQGDEISIHYDPMLGKMIVWDRDREAACRRLGEALGEIEIVGLANNAAFLAAIARHPGPHRGRNRHRLHRAPQGIAPSGISRGKR